jgi:hypothetical protein
MKYSSCFLHSLHTHLHIADPESVTVRIVGDVAERAE